MRIFKRGEEEEDDLEETVQRAKVQAFKRSTYIPQQQQKMQAIARRYELRIKLVRPDIQPKVRYRRRQ